MRAQLAPARLAVWAGSLVRRRGVRVGLLRRILQVGLSALGLEMAWLIFRGGGWGFDFYAYWRAAQGQAYDVAWGLGAYHYAPALLPVFAPFTLLPWEPAYWIWAALMLGALTWLCRGWTLAALVFPPVPAELFHGNVHLLIAVVLVLGFRYPAAWAVALLAKITPGIGLLWFALRREWRPLFIALGVTLAVTAVSVATAPDLWRQYAATLLTWRDDVSPNQIAIALPLRLVIATFVMILAARRGWPWLVPVAVTLAMPVLWIHALSTLVAIPALTRWRSSGTNSLQGHPGISPNEGSPARSGARSSPA